MTHCVHPDCLLPVPSTPDHQRLQLCALDAAYGCMAQCEMCGESWPEHGPRGRGCATWLYPPEWGEQLLARDRA